MALTILRLLINKKLKQHVKIGICIVIQVKMTVKINNVVTITINVALETTPVNKN